MNTIKHILALIATLTVAIPIAFAAITENASGIAYGWRHAHFVTAPPGWMLDTDCGAAEGVYTAFYPKHSNWNGSVIAYANANAREGRTIEQVIAADFRDLRSKSPRLKMTDGGTLPTHDGKTAFVRYYVNDAHGNSEAVAYILEKEVVINIVLAAHDETSFTLSMPAFRKLVWSYEWITSDPDHTDIMKLARQRGLHPFRFPPDEKAITKISCKLSGGASQAQMVVYLSGTMYQRVESSKSSKEPMHVVGIVNEPDVWTIDNQTHTAKRMKDSGPVYGAVLPILDQFATHPGGSLDGLQFGRELDFFQRYGQHAKSGEWAANVDGVDMKLWLKPGTNTPARIVGHKDGQSETVDFISYQTGLPFDAKLFSVPAGIKVVQANHQAVGR